MLIFGKNGKNSRNTNFTNKRKAWGCSRDDFAFELSQIGNRATFKKSEVDSKKVMLFSVKMVKIHEMRILKTGEKRGVCVAEMISVLLSYHRWETVRQKKRNTKTKKFPASWRYQPVVTIGDVKQSQIEN